MEKNHRVYTFGICDYQIYNIRKSVPELSFLEFSVQKNIDIVIDLTENSIDFNQFEEWQYMDSEFGAFQPDFNQIIMNRSKYLIVKNIHYVPLLYLFQGILDELDPEGVMEDFFDYDDDRIDEGVVKLVEFLTFLFKSRSPLNVLILNSSFELERIKRIVTAYFRKRSDCDLIHVVPNLTGADSFFEINDSDLSDDIEDPILQSCYRQMDLKTRLEIEKFKEKNKRYNLNPRSVRSEFENDMDDETDGEWKFWAD